MLQRFGLTGSQVPRWLSTVDIRRRRRKKDGQIMLTCEKAYHFGHGRVQCRNDHTSVPIDAPAQSLPERHNQIPQDSDRQVLVTQVEHLRHRLLK